MTDVPCRTAHAPAAARRAANVWLILLPLSAWMLSLAFAGPAQAEDREFGATVRHNIAAQTVDPDPQYDENITPGSIGLRSVTATRRYMLDRIRPLPDLRHDGAVGSQMSTSVTNGNAISGQGK